MRSRIWSLLALAAAAAWLACGAPGGQRPAATAGEAPRDPPQADAQPPAEEPPPEPSTLRAFMRLKLSHAQDVLEGLATEDFRRIARGAQKLRSLAADASWSVYETEEYSLYSREFVDATRQMSTAARDKNIDGAALAYVQLTLTCVQCHKHVRDVRTAQVQPAPPAVDRNSGG